MTENHTPKPWEWDYDMETLDGFGETVIWAEFDHNRQIAFLCVEEKNKLLIKTAPNLLDAVDSLLRAIALVPGAKHHKELMEAYVDGEMARRKARGEE